MKSSHSQNLVLRPAKCFLGKAARKQLNYFDPKGASKRKLPYFCQRHTLLLSQLPSIRSQSPPPFQPKPKSPSELSKSTRLLEKLPLVQLREDSPAKNARLPGAASLSPQASVSRLSQLSEIVQSCEKISKLNKSDIDILGSIRKGQKGLFQEASEFADESRDPVRFKFYRESYIYRKKPGKLSLEQMKQESFQTTYFVEKNLRKHNSIKKLREKVMPWKCSPSKFA
jgi:hypothetical protein